MRRFVWTMLYFLGVHTLVRLFQRNRLTILLYHGVDTPRDMGTYNHRGKFIATDAFERQMEWLIQHYTIIPLDEALRLLYGGGELPPYPMVITFDDGYRNNYTQAFPILVRRGIPATIFITTDFVQDRKPLWVDRLEYALGRTASTPEARAACILKDNQERERLKTLPQAERVAALVALETASDVELTDFEHERSAYAPLTWDDVKEMSGYGIMVGAHTASHPILSRLNEDDARDEVVRSLDIVKHHASAVSLVFAYPNGQPQDINDTVRRVVADAGFIAALTTVPGTNGRAADCYMLRRFSMDATEYFPLFTATVTGLRHMITSFIHTYAKRG